MPESRVTGPTGKSTAPTASATTETMNTAATHHATIMAYLTSSSLVRPAGTVSR